jgi:xanthine/CO dehydrogenase XdhC/CoxF family maturation factor
MIRQDDEKVMEQAAAWLAEGRKVAMATVITTWGSSPRPVGSQLVVDEAGNFLGSVSGGCIEGAVVHEAREAIRSGRPRTIDFGVSNEMAWEVGLACGGKIELYVEPVA